jgi:hypothetical protein
MALPSSRVTPVDTCPALTQVAYVVPNFSEFNFGYPFGANEIHLKQRDKILTH